MKLPSLTPVGIATFLLELGLSLAKLADIPYEKVMAELNKRTDVDTADLDKAADEQDAPLK